MKTAKYIVWGILLFLLVFYVIPVGLLNVPFIQTKISKVTSEKLKETLGVEVQVGNIDFELFNKLIIKDVYLEDQAGDTLLYAKRLAAGFEFLPLFKGKLLFSSAQLFSFQFNLNKETDQSPLNLQFVIDAFANKDTTKKNTSIDLHIQNLNLRRGSFSYHVKNSEETPGKFNAKHIVIKDISSKIHLERLTENVLDAKIDRMGFSEQSGLSVRRLVFDLHATNYQAEIKKLELQLSNSLLKLENFIADYSSPDYEEKTYIDFKILPSDIAPKDISAFVPLFSNYHDPVSIEGHLFGTLNELTLDEFQLEDKDNLFLEANVKLNNITKKDQAEIDGTIDNAFISTEGIKKLSYNLSAKMINISEKIYALGDIGFEGRVAGRFNNLNATGIFDTDIGSIRTDISVGKEQQTFIKGKISTNGINLKSLFDENPNLGNASFNIDIDAKINDKNKLFGNINASIGRFEFKNYSYENIQFNGEFTDKSFEGLATIDCPDGKLTANGFGKLNGKTSEFNFSAEASNIKLDKLNLSKKYKESDLSFNINADFTGNSIDNLAGSISMTDLKFNTQTGGYYLDTLAIKTIEQNNEKILSIKSDIIHGEIRGIYSFVGIVPALMQTTSKYLPSIIPLNNKDLSGMENNFSIDLTIEDTEEISHILDLPFVLNNKTKVVGQYNSIYNKFRIETYIPKFNIKNSRFESGMLLLENPGKEIELKANMVAFNKKNQKFALSSKIKIASDSILTTLNWDAQNNDDYQGQIAFGTKFVKQTENSKPKTIIDIAQTNLRLNDSIWTLHPASITIDSGKIDVNQLYVEHKNQFLKIDGTISKSKDDNLQVDLNEIDLDYIFKSLAIKSLTFGGVASGYIHLSDLYETRQLTTDLKVSDFSFNDVVFGNLDLKGSWDEQEKGIQLLGKISKDDTTKVDVNGMIYPVRKDLSIHFDALNGNIAFLNKYLKTVAKDIAGKASGHVHLFGSFKDVTVEGGVFVKNGSFGIDFLNTRYSFTDSVRLKPDEILLRNILLHDKFGRTATVNGSVKHDHFDNFTYSDTIQATNLLVFDAPERHNPMFYGTAFGTGTAIIKGNEKVVNINVSLQSNSNSKMTLNFMEESDISEYDFINFVSNKIDKDTIAKAEEDFPLLVNKPILLKTNSETEIKFNFLINATPDAYIEMVMDPVAGDKIKGYGNGNLQIQYGTKTPLKIYGNYVIEKGNYNFSLQQVIHRNFDIREGGSISFKGDPYAATLNIDAIYSLLANLGDLDEALVSQTARTNVMVNCILGISGDIFNPTIRFDIELPGSNDDLERQVKSLINSDEMMNRQIVYLLAINKFYTLENGMADDSRNNARTNDLAALASSTLASQLSNILGSMSENIQIGTRIKTSDKDFTDTEVALMLSSQLLNNRLIFNGNFGYRDNPNTDATFIGDFDLEYKWKGDIRFKVYNHYNNLWYQSLKGAVPTQGIGIMLKKDFEKVGDLFRLRPKKLPKLPPVSLKDSTTSLFYKRNEEEFIYFK